MKRRETGTKREIEVWRGGGTISDNAFNIKGGNNETALGNYCRYLFAPGDFQSNQYSARCIYVCICTHDDPGIGRMDAFVSNARAGNGGPEFRECTATVKVNARCLFHVGLLWYKWVRSFNYSSGYEIFSASLLEEVARI